MFKITSNGRNIPLNRLAAEMMADVQKTAKAEIKGRVEARLRGVSCPVHGIAVRSVRVDMKGSRGSISIHPCCEETKAAVEEIMAEMAR